MPGLRTLHACVLLLAIAGCANFKENYYFRSQSVESSNPLYYKVEIEGYSALSKTRYSAGLYNRAAVDDLFGEVDMESSLERKKGELEAEKARREKILRYKEIVRSAKEARDEAQAKYTQALKDGAAATVISAARAELTSATAAWKKAEDALDVVVASTPGTPEQVLDPSGKVIDIRDKRFVLFMTSNSDALARAIQRIAEEEATVQSIAAIANAGTRREVVANDGRLSSSLVISRAIVQSLDDGLARIGGKAHSAEAEAETRTELLGMINRIAAFYGSPHLADIDEARAWIRQNKPRIIAQAAAAGGAQ